MSWRSSWIRLTASTEVGGSYDFWLKNESLADSENLPPPAEIARGIIEDLEAALEQFRLIEADLPERSPDTQQEVI